MTDSFLFANRPICPYCERETPRGGFQFMQVYSDDGATYTWQQLWICAECHGYYVVEIDWDAKRYGAVLRMEIP